MTGDQILALVMAYFILGVVTSLLFMDEAPRDVAAAGLLWPLSLLALFCISVKGLSRVLVKRWREAGE